MPATQELNIKLIVVNYGGRPVRVPGVLLWSLLCHRGGATVVEYALIAALIALPVAVTTISVGRELSGLMHNLGAELAGVPLTEPDPPYP